VKNHWVSNVLHSAYKELLLFINYIRLVEA